MHRLICMFLAAFVAAAAILSNNKAAAMNIPAAVKPRIIRAPPSMNYQHFHRPSVELSLVDPIVRPSQRSPRLPKHIADLIEGRETSAYEEAVLNDPRFVNCMGEVGGPSDPNFVAVFAKCYSFAGRPRFGKRAWVPASAYDFQDYQKY